LNRKKFESRMLKDQKRFLPGLLGIICVRQKSNPLLAMDVFMTVEELISRREREWSELIARIEAQAAAEDEQKRLTRKRRRINLQYTAARGSFEEKQRRVV